MRRLRCPAMTDARLRHGRASLALSFFAQGMTFALLVTRIPAIQDRYGISDGLLPVFLAAVPILAGVGSVVTEQLVERVRPERGAAVRAARRAAGAARGRRGRPRCGRPRSRSGCSGWRSGAGRVDEHARGEPSAGVRAQHHARFPRHVQPRRDRRGLARLGRARTGTCRCSASYLPVVAVLLPGALVGSRWYACDGEPRAADAGTNAGSRYRASSGGRRGVQAAAAALSGDDLRLYRRLDGLQLERQVPPGRAGQLGAAVDRSVQRLHGHHAARAGRRGLGVRRFGAVAVVRFGTRAGGGRVRGGGGRRPGPGRGWPGSRCSGSGCA